MKSSVVIRLVVLFTAVFGVSACVKTTATPVNPQETGSAGEIQVFYSPPHGSDL